MKKAYIELLTKGYYKGNKVTLNDFNTFIPGIEIAEYDDFIGMVVLKRNVNRGKLLNDLRFIKRRSVSDSGYFHILNEQANGEGYFLTNINVSTIANSN